MNTKVDIKVSAGKCYAVVIGTTAYYLPFDSQLDRRVAAKIMSERFGSVMNTHPYIFPGSFVNIYRNKRSIQWLFKNMYLCAYSRTEVGDTRTLFDFKPLTEAEFPIFGKAFNLKTFNVVVNDNV